MGLERMRRFLDGVPLITKVLLLTLSLGLLLWALFDHQQNRELSQLFQSELKSELQRQAKADRAGFDQEVQQIHRAARLITGQKGFIDYVNRAHWGNKPFRGTPVEHFERPQWLPRTSVLRTFFTARHALLLDGSGNVREIYHPIPHDSAVPDIPASLLQPDSLLRKLSHNQAYLTMVDRQPYILAAQSFQADDSRTAATLLLISPIDSIFLERIKGEESHGTVFALIDDTSGQVIASSQEQRIPPGASVAALKTTYMMLGKSFFDYGSSDLHLQFASFIATVDAERLTNEIIRTNSQQRAALAFVLIFAFLLIVVWIARRVTGLNTSVAEFTTAVLGGKSLPELHGDEVVALEAQFRHLTDEIMASRIELELQAEEKIALHSKVLEGQQRARELQSLQDVTESLSIGIILDADGAPMPFNRLMQEFAEDCNGVAPFTLPDGVEQQDIILLDRHGRRRTFQLNRHPALGLKGYMVRDMTAQRMLEEERNLLASFPAKNPNPVLRIQSDGIISYLNDAARLALRSLDIDTGTRVPTAWLTRINHSIHSGLNHPIEVEVGNRVYSFVPALIEGTDWLYLHGLDVTARKQAEQQSQLSAAIMSNVLDGIVVTDTEGVVQAVNPAFTDITGYSAEEAVGQTMAILKSYRHDERFFQQMWNALHHHGSWVGEIWNRRKNGEVFPCMTRISVIKDDHQRITHFVSTFSDISDRKRYEEQLSHLAYHDALTGLPNRLLFQDRLRHSIHMAERNPQQHAVLFIDLDGFKEVNDRYGHDVGDQLLYEVARRLSAAVRGCDTVCRLGGDEFALLLQNVRDAEAALKVADTILLALCQPFDLQGRQAQISGSIGVVLYPAHGHTSEELLRRADQSMYRAKQRGKNNHYLYVEQTLTKSE